jgi:ABC-2 type transport system ATP-binding protein
MPRSERKKKIEEVVAEVKMEEWLDKKVGKFSKGMKQRINISAALLSEPEILLLDEPSTGLDPRGMSEVREIVKSLKHKNRLIFMSSHLLNEVSEICDEVAMIDHGKLLVYDKLNNVVSRFSGDGGEIIIDVGLSRDIDDQTLSKNISSLQGVVSAERVEMKSLRIKFSGSLETQERLLADLVALKIGLVSFHPSSSALEDTYLNLIKATL